MCAGSPRRSRSGCGDVRGAAAAADGGGSSGGRRRCGCWPGWSSLHAPTALSVEGAEALVGDPATYTDPVVTALDAAAAWRGVILRSWYVEAWRSLWAWTLNTMPPASPAEQLGDRLADTLTTEFPAATLGDLVDSLPDGIGADGQPTIVDREPPILDLPDGAREVTQLIIGAGRAGRLAEQVGGYFEDPVGERRNRQLTPSGFAGWLHRPPRPAARRRGPGADGGAAAPVAAGRVGERQVRQRRLEDPDPAGQHRRPSGHRLPGAGWRDLTALGDRRAGDDRTRHPRLVDQRPPLDSRRRPAMTIAAAARPVEPATMNLTQLLHTVAAGDAWPIEDALFLTFGFDPGFFERGILGRCRAAGAVVTVIADATMWAPDPIALRTAGQEYLLGLAATPRAFHPKLMLLQGRDGALAAIGSGNLTTSGWQYNTELWRSFEATPAGTRRNPASSSFTRV